MSLTGEAYITAHHMDVGYGNTPLIRDICLQVRPGQIVTLIGPNGAGKSTILKSIIRQLELLGGRVCVGGQSLKELSDRQLARRVSALMTGQIRPELMSCEEVAAMGRYPYTGFLGILSPADKEAVRQALSLVQASDLAERDFSELSDGQKQRILLARAICQEPEAIILDEPTSFLDIRHKLELLSILKKLVRERQTAVLLSLHELDLAQRLSDYVVCVKGDQILRMGTPEEIFTTPSIKELYGITKGSYQAELGLLELEPPSGPPEVFVIGGNGTGIPVYRSLQRKGIPFAAGVLHENDLDYPVAKALAVQVVAEEAFEPIGEKAFSQAVSLMEQCRKVICCLEKFGTINEKNRELLALGREKQMVVDEL